MLPCSRATSSARSRHSFGTRSRSHSGRSRSTLRPSWPMWRGRMSSGVVALPRSCVSAAKRTGNAIALRRRVVEHHHHVHAGIDFRVIVGALRHAPQRIDFRQNARERAAVAQHVEHARRLRLHQSARHFLPHALGHERIDFAVRDHLLHQRARFRRDGEIREARGKAREAQNAHRVFDKRIADMAEQLALRDRRGRRTDRSPARSVRRPGVTSRAIALIVRSRRARSSSSVTSGE